MKPNTDRSHIGEFRRSIYESDRIANMKKSTEFARDRIQPGYEYQN